ncbi:hypothetical protein [Mangrovicoccus sp. HB161399]|uniref:hypothetical protein n=1 Tax=Mangrovicoccus sp. HB161399 TaxID=2720392 RepID=UPI001551B1B8|nr:hypothetical protein [Mangrovicoccus sp. HB161399]
MLGVLVKSADGATEYRLRFTTNAMVAFEEETGSSILSIAKSFDAGDEGAIKFSTVRLLAWASLLHGDRGITQEAAGDVIDACGFPAFMAAIGEAIHAAFPDADGAPKRGNGRSRRKAAASTGAA